MLKQTQNEFLQSVVKETQSDEAFVGNSRKPPDKGSSMSVLSGLQVRGRAPASLGRGRREATIGNLGQKTSRRSQVAQERKPPFLQWEGATLCEQPMCLIRVTVSIQGVAGGDIKVNPVSRTVKGGVGPPKIYPHPTPRTCWCCLFGKGNFISVIKHL